jgi:MoaA/NifB/PqqE/SkfB family radical SAM enzyme
MLVSVRYLNPPGRKPGRGKIKGETMPEVEKPQTSDRPAQPFRMDVQIHDLLMKPKAPPQVHPALQPKSPELLTLPEPVFPQSKLAQGGEMTEKEFHWMNTKRGFKGWAFPFVKSLFHKGELRPIITYLFSEYKCNVDCHYCWSYNNNVKGMTEDTARRSVDWIHSIGGRVLALMGGEPLLRPGFVHKVVDYAAKKDFFVYLPTNGYLARPEVVDRIGDAGVAVWNLAIDCVEERPGLPKALNRIRPHFDYLVKNQHRYGYSVMININITHINQDDVKQLTELAHGLGLATDYHLNESPLTEQPHFKHMDRNGTYLTKDDFPKVDDLLDWIVDKQAHGYKMPNPRQHFFDMKELMRGKVAPWECRAGQNNLIIRTDGTLAPCFPMYSASYDWGTVGHHKFDVKQLDEMKKDCSTHCLSTCNRILAHCYNSRRAMEWVLKQALRGFKGVTGSFED